MRHTFVLHVTLDTGDTDPSELMGDIEADARYGGLDNYPDVSIECVDATEATP